MRGMGARKKAISLCRRNAIAENDHTEAEKGERRRVWVDDASDAISCGESLKDDEFV